MRTPFAGVGATLAKVKSNPDQVKRMLRGTLKSLEFTVNPANREKVLGLIMEEFKLHRQQAERALTESLRAFSKDGIMPDDAVKAEIEDLRQRLRLKGEISISQLVDYTLLKEVLAEMSGRARSPIRSEVRVLVDLLGDGRIEELVHIRDL